MDDPRSAGGAHLWVAPGEGVDPAEVFLGRLVAGAGSPARFHVTANGGWVGAPAEEVDETKPRPLSLSLSLLPRTTSGLSQVWQTLGLLLSLCTLVDTLGMNELTKAADVTSELQKISCAAASLLTNHIRCSRQLQRFRCRACPGHFRLGPDMNLSMSQWCLLSSKKE